jgi:hypothetical protein
MKRALLVLLAVYPLAAAADLELPRPSPFAKVTLAVGLTDVTVDYSSPAVKGRVIWGELVPYDKLWRTGANTATKITFSKDVTVADKAIPAGTYALFTIPGKTTWTVILNKNAAQSGTTSYKQELDIARFEVTPQAIAPRERLTFLFADFTDDTAALELEWEKLRITIPIKTKTTEQALANIKAATSSAWRPLANAARYQLERKDYDAGLALVEKSLLLQEEWLNLFTKAQLLAAKGRFKDALPLAEKAQTLGAKVTPTEQYFLSKEVKQAIAEWKTKK